MGCCGRKFGPGQLSTARRTRLKREKRGGFPPLLLNTMHFTPDIVANSRGVLKYSLNGVCPFHFSSQILSLTHSACSDCLFCSVLKFYNIFIILSWHYSSSSLSSLLITYLLYHILFSLSRVFLHKFHNLYGHNYKCKFD